MLTEQVLRQRHLSFNDDPKGLIVVTDQSRRPIEMLARRVDGAYPDIVNPIALWETKEYYGTTTFGSRVADGIYETMLDGEELQHLEQDTKRKVLHYLIVDDHYTWWGLGRSYLCRIVDMLHVGQVDEVVFGKEVFTRWPAIVQSWPAP